jgi:rfaE bifunctional protein nucleotidyltransferase chain/domain
VPPTAQKIVTDHPELLRRIREIRGRGGKIVLTNGAFDLLHVGHIRSLEHAKTLGDALVVAVNSDRSVRESKGPGRPIIPERERAEIVAALQCVDLVTIFDETTVEETLRRVVPDIHAKGRDYTESSVPERKVVEALGGKVVIVGDPKDHATSDLIERIRGGKAR